MLENINYSDMILTIIAILISFIAFRINISFNLNDWLKDRKKIKIVKFQNICPHTSIFKNGEYTVLESDFRSPPGTSQWQCKTCKRIVDSVDDVDDDMKYWRNNTEDLLKRKKTFYKQLKKSGY